MKRRLARAAGGLLLLACQWAVAAPWTVAVVGLVDDARYHARQLEHAYPDHPAGRPDDAARVALLDSESELEAAGQRLQVKVFMASNATDLPRVMAELKAAKIQHVLLDLPDAELQQIASTAAVGPDAPILFNIGSPSDVLRGTACALAMLHTYPSRQMLSDALVQYLAARSWTQALVLYGQAPQDTLQLDAFVRSAKRYGLRIQKTAQFKVSGDPRERDLSNTRLLTNDKGFDVVVVLDSEGEFARTLPYTTQWPRPVVGSNGLTAMAWHPQWERNGGPQLSRRFFRYAHRPMAAQDWAAWIAVKSIVAVLTEQPKASVAEQLKRLRGGQVAVDGYKGPRLSFRSWDGQLRQPIFLGHADGVAGIAPFDGVLHPTEVLDTLGVDQKESTCKKQL
ncbi:branched-chain amino acid ABC transporter substrate-binding protein [Rhodoferax sp. WC2427]|uniref:branched-chain amino acid ABC transporter substrate-binding protein n=1 Tax=Rhodoferax sp. WC2427 TaxID=3234144 RepID=UPI003467C4B9